MAAIAGESFHFARVSLPFINICTLAYLVMLAFALLKLRKEHGLLDLVNLKRPWFQSCQSYRLWSVCPFTDPVFPINLAGLQVALLIGIGIYFGYGYRPLREKINKT